MAVTISTHNGSAVSREHNIRNRKVTDKEGHIDPHGQHETWHDEKVRDAYQRLFGEAVRDYNSRQRRKDRQISDYYKEICNDKKKHPVYEMIIAIGNKENRIDDSTGYEIMRRFVRSWKKRNPNLEVIGAYYHNDEQGVPHVHIDYIPVAHGYKNGMETQNGLVKALEEMGFSKQGKETAQIQWERRENRFLEKLCNEHGIEVEHPDEGLMHLDTGIYQAQKDLEELERQIFVKESDILQAESEREHLELLAEHERKTLAFLKAENADLSAEREKLWDSLADVNKRLKEAKTGLQEAINELSMLERGLKACDEAKEMMERLENVTDLVKPFVPDIDTYIKKEKQQIHRISQDIQRATEMSRQGSPAKGTVRKKTDSPNFDDGAR